MHAHTWSLNGAWDDHSLFTSQSCYTSWCLHLKYSSCIFPFCCTNMVVLEKSRRASACSSLTTSVGLMTSLLKSDKIWKSRRKQQRLLKQLKALWGFWNLWVTWATTEMINFQATCSRNDWQQFPHICCVGNAYCLLKVTLGLNHWIPVNVLINSGSPPPHLPPCHLLFFVCVVA